MPRPWSRVRGDAGGLGYRGVGVVPRARSALKRWRSVGAARVGGAGPAADAAAGIPAARARHSTSGTGTRRGDRTSVDTERGRDSAPCVGATRRRRTGRWRDPARL